MKRRLLHKNKLTLHNLKHKIHKTMRFGRTILLTTFISILAIMAGCTQGTSEARLAQIDSLLERKLYDSARAELSRIAPSDLKSEEDIAHYNLQKTNLCFRNGEVLPNDSMIDRHKHKALQAEWRQEKTCPFIIYKRKTSA